MLTRRRLVATGSAALVLPPLAITSARAQPAPLKSTRIVVGYAPGGTTDLVARRVAEKLGGSFAETAIVDNRSGAGGQIACMAVKGAAPDGQTLLCTPYSCMVIFPFVYKKLGYDPVADFVPVGIAATTTQAMAVGPMVPASVKTLPDYVAWVRANPQFASYGSPAAGSTSHFLGALLGLESKLPLVQVPYRGAVPGIADVVAGQIPVMFTTTGDLLPHYKAGKLRLLGTSGPRRTVFTPEVPTFAEQGFPMLSSEEWFGFYAPAGTPASVVKNANEALRLAMANRAVVDSLAGVGLVASVSSPEEMAESQRAQTERWGPLVRKIGFTAES
ncbi:MAG: Bug family tripartite tricarboxylate transporter substrate binding protein [Gammaproteobacteria bacterium]|uniref:Bug family tripartite tricarboxylate transporter substrate binding protein n=1 Tax=unclassified Pseudacidovorax TaxID=2620592 RepID=UPI001B777090|nr:Bug family tripartite tricarboxylate transporter substrate binding protein [Pseudacidovorax sp.]MBP6893190.1 Bug family tripartite tricarboxylate transporter substrate binding protein [Pseudacidovorax sp.]